MVNIIIKFEMSTIPCCVVAHVVVHSAVSDRPVVLLGRGLWSTKWNNLFAWYVNKYLITLQHKFHSTAYTYYWLYVAENSRWTVPWTWFTLLTWCGNFNLIRVSWNEIKTHLYQKWKFGLENTITMNHGLLGLLPYSTCIKFANIQINT